MAKLGMGALLFGAILAQSAMADELPAWMTERRIIGHNDLEPIEATLNTSTYEKARIVARVETSANGDGFCTSSRVGKDLFLTNYHCFEYKPCAEIQFHIGYEKALAAADQQIYACKEVLAKNLNLDYAIYRVEPKETPPPGRTQTHSFTALALSIPDNDTVGVTKDFAIPQTGTIQDVKVHVKIRHSNIGDLRIELASPAGTVVTLQETSSDSGTLLDKTFTLANGLSVLAGETIAGAWKITVKDLAAADTGKLDTVEFTFTSAEDESPAPASVTEALEYPTAVLWAGPIQVGQLLLVASHPGARLKEIDRSATCVLRTIATEVVSERTTITHTCDTEGGSSGSPVLDRETGAVVALHWGGTDQYNLSIPMSLITADLERNLTPEAFSELTIKR